MNETIKKPPRAREAKNVITTDRLRPVKANLTPPPHFCDPPECTGAYSLGRDAAEYYLRHGGSETNLLQMLNKNLCPTCKANLLAGYFIRKEQLEAIR